MSRRPIVAALGALLLGLPVLAQAQSSTPTPAKESGSPINDQGSNYNYRSNITSITPNVPGLSLEVLEFADRLVLRNHTGKTVTVYGYQGEPYARVLADGAVQVNTRSPAYYLNQNFYANVNVPSSASPTRDAHWTVVDRTGAARMARPSHPLDVPGAPAAGQGQEQAHQDLQLAGADQGRSQRRGSSTASCSGFPRKAPRPRPVRSWRWS